MALSRQAEARKHGGSSDGKQTSSTCELPRDPRTAPHTPPQPLLRGATSSQPLRAALISGSALEPKKSATPARPSVSSTHRLALQAARSGKAPPSVSRTMSSTMVEQPRRPDMATPGGSSAVAEPMEVDKHDSANLQTSNDVPKTSNSEQATSAQDKSEDVPMTASATAEDAVVNQTSNVPTASETSRQLVARAKRRLQIQLQFVEKARRQVQDETHPDMKERLRVLVEERDHLLQVAKQRNEHFEHGTNVIFTYECDEANSEFELQCEKLRQDMLEEIHHEMEILHDQRKGGHSSARKTTRKTRSTRSKDGSESSSGSGFAFDTAQKIKKRAGYVFQPLENTLAQSEVDHDLRELSGVYESTKKRRMDSSSDTEPPLVAKYHRSKLLYRDWVFQEGDEVYVLNYPASSEYVAIICAITSTEVLVLSEKGKYYRLVIMDIRQGRVVLTTMGADQAAATRDDAVGITSA